MPDEQVVAVEPQIEAEAQAESSAEAAPVQEGETEPQVKTEPKKGGVQKRIDELVRERETARLEAEFWKAKVTAGTEGSPRPEAKPAVADSAAPEPNEADYESATEWVRAHNAWSRLQAQREWREDMARKEREDQQRKEERDTQMKWGQRLHDIREKTENFDELVQAAQNVPVNPAMARALMTSDVGGEMYVHLLNNLEDARRIALIQNPERVLIEMGKLEAKLAGEAKGQGQPAPQTISKAPKPITPVKKANPVDDGELRDDLDPREWRRRFEEKRERART